MNISVAKDRERMDLRRVHVYLNGERVRECFEADDEAGFVKCFKLDADGRKYIDRSLGEAAKETLYGQIEIRIEPEGRIAPEVLT